VVLLEANERRAQFLERAVMACDLQDRVRVVHQRAEICGRDAAFRGTFDGVVVRSFGPPAVVAECAAPLLRVDGWLIVSEPPNNDETEGKEAGPVPDRRDTQVATPAGSERWPEDQLAPLGLQPVESVRNEFGYQILRQYSLCPNRFPRRNGVPAKKPLF
jgi:16S rRNA (guanine527-N7)-methyltransferase